MDFLSPASFQALRSTSRNMDSLFFAAAIHFFNSFCQSTSFSASVAGKRDSEIAGIPVSMGCHIPNDESDNYRIMKELDMW